MIKILFLAANPKNTPPFRLEEELRQFDVALGQAKQREQFNLMQRWIVQPMDLRRSLLEYEPEIVHFAGHGTGLSGIQLGDNIREVTPVSSETLTALFRLFTKIKCIFLNACYIEEQANAIASHVNYVIGMRYDVDHIAATRFAIEFYKAIGAGTTYESAIKLVQVAAHASTNENTQPVLEVKKNKRKYQVKVDSNLNIENKAFGARIYNNNVFIPPKLAQVLDPLLLGDDAMTIAGFLAAFPTSVASSLNLSPEAVGIAANDLIDLLEKSGVDVSLVRDHVEQPAHGAKNPKHMNREDNCIT